LNGQQPHTAIRIDNLQIGYHSVSGEIPFTRKTNGFSVCEGEMVALIGPNGIGKSTLLRTLAGFQKPLSGDILISGWPISRFTPKELARKISFVSTENIRIANMRVADLVAYGRFPYTNWMGHLLPEDKRRVREAIQMVGLQHLAQKPVTRLSDGERQRSVIARALAQDTPLMILDEPTAFLDVSNKYGIFHLLHNLARQHNKTVILSTHDLNIALREMDKLWIMLENETIEGAPEDAVLHGWLNRLFKDDNIGFDAVEGDFFFRKEHAGYALVRGEGLPYRMTVRALERKGYQIIRKGDPDITVTVLPDLSGQNLSWKLTKGNETSCFESIHSLMVNL